jgi:hypothetical protein
MRRGHAALLSLGALYLAGLWLNGVGSSIPERHLPRPVLFFLQATKLFTHAGTVTIDYRAEAWLCDERRWVELDTRPYFAIHKDDKESRFHRTLHFYRRHRATMQALESYLIEAHHARHASEGLPRGARVGGMRFSSLRLPIPAPGQPVGRWQRKPFADHPKERQKRWYWTPRSKRAARCGGTPPRPEEDE